ncbi:alpha-L RNA-binding motif-containing protein [Sodiomyces alkalinus F11]|uniref:Alpha-L RNA-binding motif-containing protein n=1 Tax=Sodiomyces alkalinus (strain CBS 110278 / VKM F-3762 / F11) TaxID=1314773 RepID=A0A3N2Q8I3_SODAK|nr:alpha-L RNA-binding motif-containing protein [Sodiomyces alkalinus F11]ROT43046.1 alpha-L RNA-binding motif-containing protein [Sodiomyces alkalinus F11]
MRSRRPRFYNLKRPKVRQSWNKFNLYNLARLTVGPTIRYNRTFFQQKWIAKSIARGYHGPHVRERDWERMFSRRLLSAVELPPAYLASHDGSEQAAGRGSGREHDPNDPDPPISATNFSPTEIKRRSRLEPEKKFAFPNTFAHPDAYYFNVKHRTPSFFGDPVRDMTPYMQMTFAPLERRLDVAIFRALFASSTLQARQFCVHGAVKVNGKTMRHPAYLLNPGDMFQVDPERVLYATGEPKNPKEAARIESMLKQQEEREAAREASAAALHAAKKQQLAEKLKNADQQGGGDGPQAEAASADTPLEAETQAVEEGAAAETKATTGLDKDGEPLTAEELAAEHRSQLKALIRDAKRLLSEKDKMGAKQKQRVRLFMSEAKRALSRLGKKDVADSLEDLNAETTAAAARDGLMNHLAAILKGLHLDQQPTQTSAEAEKEGEDAAAAPRTFEEEVEALSPGEQAALARLLKEDAENPVDESKPYLTPWRPRKYLAPFAFVPRYLEVNQNICAAVYLRHPVARRGSAEVPTPLPYETSQLAFNWYLRRR